MEMEVRGNYRDYNAWKDCTTNTNRADREIKKLKKLKQQLEQQIKAASGDEKRRKELEQELARIEAELSQKDNDAYRRQNARKRLFVQKLLE